MAAKYYDSPTDLLAAIRRCKDGRTLRLTWFDSSFQQYAMLVDNKSNVYDVEFRLHKHEPTIIGFYDNKVDPLQFLEDCAHVAADYISGKCITA